MPAKTKTTKTPLTTAQQLGSLIKSARDIMRKDKGLNGDLDRLPMLTWVMFLKFLDDLEQIREEKALIAGKPYRPVIEAPYRWRDWAANEENPTGDELKAFIGNDEITGTDDKKMPGLFAYLRSLQADRDNPTDPRRTIATVFKEVSNRMQSGYLLRDVVNKVNGIHFNSSEEIHTLGHLYESMLKEMRDAAGDSGEFYTPRAVVRFMVAVTDPRLGETVLDPACGTGGFLVEAYQHLERQCRTVQDRRTLQESSILGGEAKPLPYLLAQMNLLLHGLEAPQISPDNSLKIKVTEIGDRDRVDVILTNPPFGGEEERGILGNFPDDKQTAETALLFMQLIMRKLRRPRGSDGRAGRAAVVVPNGMLFGDGIAARVKEDLLLNYNLHTVVRLPNGVFAPYTSIPTNLLFFDRTGATEEIWYYELPPPAGRKNYSKTAPMQYEEFADCLAWWKERAPNDRAWRVNIAERICEARAAATPHWEAAQQADAKAKELAREIKEVNDQLQRLKRPEIPLLQSAAQQTEREASKLETRRAKLQNAEAAERERARAEQAAGDAIYWPVFNLDLKNPSAKQDFEHLPPEQLADDILKKEQRIAELMAEIKEALAEASI
ncbi:MAG: N-6 DNA methylase [Blastocatellales bacterium]